MGLARVLPLLVGLGGAAAQNQATFDRSVLGNLQGDGSSSSKARPLKMSRSNAMVASISVGTPPQAMHCLLDSGSSDLWVPSTHCQNCQNKHKFYADRSSTFAPRLVPTPYGDRPVPVHITYGSGEIVGYPVQDTVSMGGVTMNNQSFIIVEDAHLPPHRTWDGICGLGWTRMASAGEPFYKHLQATGQKALVSLVPTAAQKAYIMVGEVPDAACKPNSLAWAQAETVAPGSPMSFWVTSGGLAIHKTTPVKARFLVDTGTSFLLVPPRVWSALVRSVFPNDVFGQQCGVDAYEGNLVVCDCSVMQAQGMLPLRVQLGGREFTLQVPDLFKKVKAKGGGDLCLLQMQQNPMTSSPDPMDLLSGLLGGGGDGLLSGLLGGGGGGGHGGTVPVIIDGSNAGPSAQGNAGGSPFGGSPFGGSGGSPFGGEGLPPFPFPMPGFGPPPGADPQGAGWLPPGLIGGGPGGAGPQVGEQVEEVIQTMPDGSVCTQMLVLNGGKVQKNTTKCSAPGEKLPQAQLPAPLASLLGQGRRLAMADEERRRLQGFAPMQQDPMDDLWVLGGVFLEHFVTVFDFDQTRIGFCEPTGAPPPGSEPMAPSRLDMMQDAPVVPALTAPREESARASGPMMTMGFVLMVSVAGLVGFQVLKGFWAAQPGREGLLPVTQPLQEYNLQAVE